MISEIQLENFKSVENLTLRPGQVTVLIGENGSGKSNVLEAIGFASAAIADKLDDEFLVSRGIRVTEKDWMVSRINEASGNREDPLTEFSPIQLRVFNNDSKPLFSLSVLRLRQEMVLEADPWMIQYRFTQEEITTAKESQLFADNLEAIKAALMPFSEKIQDSKLYDQLAAFQIAKKQKLSELEGAADAKLLKDFLIYSPENSVLRRFDDEGAIRPLGTKGEGLLKHLQFLASNPEFAKDLKHHLQLLGWFSDLELPTEADEMRGRLRIRDRWLSEDAPVFDQRSANEGFLYLLFYFTLMMSKHTPKFFAIDNIDNALNPKLCAELMRQLAVLAAKHGKQLICTTHNPAILDGLNLNDDTQRLYVVRRDSEGHTVVNRVNAPRPRPDGKSIRLSTAFMEGMLGGLPDHF